jgi:mono/diheme cytochrome c family protein
MKSVALAITLLAASAAAQTAPDGAALFTQHCAICHQPDGAGAVGLAPALKGEHWAKLGARRDYLATVLVHGLSGPIKVNGVAFVGIMPAFGAQLDDTTLAAIATQLGKLQGTDTKAYAADEIKAARDQAGSPPQTRQLRTQIVGP